ncbi:MULTISPECIES: WhiB family transcriptional regulator [Nocardia]|uniref:WhiB family transcriptional regulator n=1 Tax=Nocardia TaxID=1817 RepID=UPI001300A3FD|nr:MULTISPECIES: WhiB family transcriptional regulator [Nocardia]
MATYDRDWMVRSKCRTATDPSLYDADNRGSSNQQAERLEKACGGCDTVAECAAYALKHQRDAGGYVWAGIPVPQTSGTKFWNRAMEKLVKIRGEVRL